MVAKQDLVFGGFFCFVLFFPACWSHISLFETLKQCTLPEGPRSQLRSCHSIWLTRLISVGTMQRLLAYKTSCQQQNNMFSLEYVILLVRLKVCWTDDLLVVQRKTTTKYYKPEVSQKSIFGSLLLPVIQILECLIDFVFDAHWVVFSKVQE